MSHQSNKLERPLLLIALLALLAQGLVRIAVVPLWAHYDEPGHYEYMRYLVEEKRLPDLNRPNFSILNRIAATYGPDTSVSTMCDPSGLQACIQVGQQFDEMPGYYLLQAVFQIMLPPHRIYSHVLVARLISVILSVMVGLLGYLAAKELFSTRGLLAVAIPVVLSVR